MDLPHLSQSVPAPIYFITPQPGQLPALEGMREPQAQLAEPPSPSLGIALGRVLQTAEGQSGEKGNIAHDFDTRALFFEPCNSPPPFDLISLYCKIRATSHVSHEK